MASEGATSDLRDHDLEASEDQDEVEELIRIHQLQPCFVELVRLPPLSPQARRDVELDFSDDSLLEELLQLRPSSSRAIVNSCLLSLDDETTRPDSVEAQEDVGRSPLPPKEGGLSLPTLDDQDTQPYDPQPYDPQDVEAVADDPDAQLRQCPASPQGRENRFETLGDMETDIEETADEVEEALVIQSNAVFVDQSSAAVEVIENTLTPNLREAQDEEETIIAWLLQEHDIKQCSVTLERLSDEFVRKAESIVDDKRTRRRRRKLKKKGKRRKWDSDDGDEEDEHHWEPEASSSEDPSYCEDDDQEQLKADNIKLDNYQVPGTRRLTRKRQVRDPDDLGEPEAKKRKVRLHECIKCSFTTNIKKNLVLHTAVHKPPDFGNNLRYKCDVCPVNCHSLLELKRHTYEQHQAQNDPRLKRTITYGCKSCKQFFDSQMLFESHLIFHFDNDTNFSDSGKYKCPFCTSSSIKKQTLLNHMITKHTNYKCTFCEHSAITLQLIERHCVTSHQEFGRPFACNLCDFKSAVFGYLTVHRKEKHAIDWNNNLEKCRFCNIIQDNNRDSILRHFALHVEMSFYHCMCCPDYRTNSPKQMEAHGVQVHGTADISAFNQPFDVEKLLASIKNLMRQRLRSNKETENKIRAKPSFNETQQAVDALLGVEPEIQFGVSASESLLSLPSAPDPGPISSMELRSTTTSSIFDPTQAFITPSTSENSNDVQEDYLSHYLNRKASESQLSDGPLFNVWNAPEDDGDANTLSIPDFAPEDVQQPLENVLSLQYDEVTGQVLYNGEPIQVFDEQMNQLKVSPDDLEM